ncbi:hypothetical protein GCM10010508_21830 [Streptomyces naganishii JCM 4654]|uniref:Uncharacterized protein n=1 Tax=Streptomyces naganishii JCM 4654 TaxID=1306179 RepID=A0A918Y1K7_9ACTN|nr:hypothetical protein GCM10010508_21830 [Streptomyces naganishii JCM 4654]
MVDGVGGAERRASWNGKWSPGRVGPLRQFTVGNSNHGNHTVQTRALHAYLRWRNRNIRHPDVLAAQRRERARVRSENGDTDTWPMLGEVRREAHAAATVYRATSTAGLPTVR